VEDRSKEEKLTPPMTLPPLEEQTLTELRRCSAEAAEAETHTCYQMRLPGARGQNSVQIAAIVFRRQARWCECSSAFSPEGSRRFRDAVARQRADDHPGLGGRTAASPGNVGCSLPEGRGVGTILHDTHPGTLIYGYPRHWSPQHVAQYLSRLYQARAGAIQIGIAVKRVDPTSFDGSQ